MTAADGLATYLDLLFGAEPSGYATVRWRLLRGRGMGGSEFLPVRHPRLAEFIRAKGRTTDVYMGVAPRARPDGTRAGVERCHVLWVDCDDAGAIERLGAFRPRPSMVVVSGTGRHAYWSLWPPVGPDEAEAANRRIAHALGGDMRAVDAARILRPPGSHNFKSGSPVPVTVASVLAATYTVEQLVGHLPDPPAPRPPAPPRWGRAEGDDPLMAIPAPVYVAALTGRDVGRDGKIACPFHEDNTPSLHCYDEAERGFVCFGCGRGGTIIDFGAALYGIEPRGSGFHEIRRRLEHDLRARAAA